MVSPAIKEPRFHRAPCVDTPMISRNTRHQIGHDFRPMQSSKSGSWEAVMDSTGSGRRRFLKQAAALTGVAAGAGVGAEWAARGQSAPPAQGPAKFEGPAQDAHHGDLLRRGARMSVDHITYYTPLQDYGGNHHAGPASLRAVSRVPLPGDRCGATSPHDPRPGGPSFEFQHGRSEAVAFSVPRSFRGVPRQQLSDDP